MHMNLPDKDFDSRYVMACEDAWDYQTSLGLCTWFTSCSRLSLTSEWKANVCVESMSLVLNPDSHAFNGFHFNVCVSSQESICA